MASSSPGLKPLLAKLAARIGLGDDDREAILALPFAARTLAAGQSIIRAGDTTRSCTVLLGGFAYRHNILRNGQRQVLGIHLEGDVLDLRYSPLRPADNNVQALTQVEIATIPLAAMVELIRARPIVAEALWSEMLADMSVFKEWIANVGRRDARARVAHIICEMSARQAAIGRGGPQDCDLPMTQEQLGDTLGLTSVHVNRTLQRMERDGLIGRDRRMIHIPDWNALAQAGDFSATYLHLPPPAAA